MHQVSPVARVPELPSRAQRAEDDHFVGVVAVALKKMRLPAAGVSIGTPPAFDADKRGWRARATLTTWPEQALSSIVSSVRRR